MIDVNDFSKLSFKNRVAVEASQHIGCYFCLMSFITADFDIEYTDRGETALCPNCEIDSIVPNVTDKNILQAAHERWFCKPVPTAAYEFLQKVTAGAEHK